MQPSVVAHYVLDIMSQGSHISERYYKSRIPKGSHTLGCNHIRVNPTGRCTTTQLPGLARTAKGSDAAVAKFGAPRVRRLIFPGQYASRSETPSNDCTSHQAVAGRQPSPPVQVGTNQRTCERPTQLRRVSITSVQRTTLRLPPSGAAVQASLAPAQPPPPAGLASSSACSEYPDFN
jgi:hypothetical protein